MSRTNRGGRGGGDEYWGRRNQDNGHDHTMDKVTKKKTHKRERQQNRAVIDELCQEAEDAEADLEEFTSLIDHIEDPGPCYEEFDDFEWLD